MSQSLPPFVLTTTLALGGTLALYSGAGASPPCLEVVGALPYGAGQAVDVAGNTAFVGAGSALLTVDVSDPAVPFELGRVRLRGVVLSVDVLSGLAVVAAGRTGIHLVDVSEPTEPTVVASLRLPGSARSAAWVGGHVVVAAGPRGLRVVDAAQPAQPVEVARFPTTDARWVSVTGSLAVVADGAGGVRVVDLTDPTAPVELGWTPLPDGEAVFAMADGNRAVVEAAPVDEEVEASVVDLSAPSHPVITVTLTLPEAGGAAFQGSFLYLSVNTFAPPYPYPIPTLELWDLGWGGGQTYTGSLFHRIAVGGPAAVLVGGAWGSGPDVTVVDVTDPTAPLIPGTGLDTQWRGRDVAVDGRWAYVGGDGGFRVVDISDPAAPVEVAFAPGDEGITHAVDVEDHLLVALRETFRACHVDSFDVSDPAAPAMLGTLQVPYLDHDDLVLHHGFALLPAGHQGLLVLSFLDPARPKQVAAFDVPGDIFLGLDVQSDLAYLANAYSGLVVADVTNPAAPVEVARMSISYPAGHGPSDVAVSGGVACLAGRDKLVVISVADPTAPAVLQELPPLGSRVAMDGSRAYSVSGGTLRWVDLNVDQAGASHVGRASLLGIVWANPRPFAGRVYVPTSSGLEILAPCGPSPSTPDDLGGDAYPSN